MLRKYIRNRVELIVDYLDRNNRMLNSKKFKQKKNYVNVHWWKLDGDMQNIGDYLSELIVKYMCDYYGVDFDKKIKRKRNLYAVGSIIQAGYQDTTVWGSGLLWDMQYWWKKMRKLDVRCVRGPVTREILMKNGFECPERYGDPAILMPLIYTAQKGKRFEYVVIPHHSQLNKKQDNVISPLVGNSKEMCNFIDCIVGAKLVISSSLHGIILAESYGIPAILLMYDGMDITKYNDYYFSTNRYEYPKAKTIEEALRIEPVCVPDLDTLKQNVIETFPVDLWE